MVIIDASLYETIRRQGEVLGAFMSGRLKHRIRPLKNLGREHTYEIENYTGYNITVYSYCDLP